jgi:hypothetical protein
LELNRFLKVTKRTSEDIHSSGNNSIIFKIVVVNILFILFFYRSNLLGQGTIPYDIQWYQFPHYSYLFQHLKDFAIPIWDPYTYGGGPYFANSQNQLFYLPNLIYTLLNSLLFAESTIRQLQLFQIINHFIFVLGLSFLSYKIKPNIYTAISIASICGFSGMFISDLQHVGQINSITWIPWLLLSLQKVKENNLSSAWKGVSTLSLLFICTGGFIIALLPVLSVVFIYGFDNFKELKHYLNTQKYSLLFVALITLLSLLYPFIWSRENFGQSAVNFDFDLFDFATALFPNYFNSFSITQYSGSIDITKGYNFIGPILILLVIAFFRLDKIKKVKIYIALIVLITLFSDSFVQLVTTNNTLSIFRPIEFRVLILITIFYLLNWVLSLKIEHKWFVIIGILTAFYSIILVIQYNKFNNIIMFLSVLMCLIYLNNQFSENKKIPTILLMCGIFMLTFHSLVPNQIWKAEGSGNYFNERYMRGGNAEDLLNIRNEVGQNSRIATSSFKFGGDFWNGWRVWGLRSINGWEPHINVGFGELAQIESSQKNNRFFGDFNLDSDFLKAFAVNQYITSDSITNSTNWEIYQNNSFNFAKRKIKVSPVSLTNCENSDSVKFKYSEDKFSVPKYEIELDDNSKNCILHISEIYRQDWLIKNSSSKKLEINLDKYNTILINDINGVSNIVLSIDKNKYIAVFVLYYLSIVLFFIILLLGKRTKLRK